MSRTSSFLIAVFLSVLLSPLSLKANEALVDSNRPIKALFLLNPHWPADPISRLSQAYGEEETLVAMLRSVTNDVHVLRGGAVTPDSIQRYLNRVGQNDTLFIYYSGLAGVSGTDSRPFLKGVETPFRRDGLSTIWWDSLNRWIDERNARLTVFITETFNCSSPAVERRDRSYSPTQAAQVLNSLLSSYVGKVYWNASLSNQQAYGIDRVGGLFTQALTDTIGRIQPTDLGLNGPQSVVSWKQFTNIVQNRTESLFKDLSANLYRKPAQSTQTPDLTVLDVNFSEPAVEITAKGKADLPPALEGPKSRIEEPLVTDREFVARPPAPASTRVITRREPLIVIPLSPRERRLLNRQDRLIEKLNRNSALIIEDAGE